MHRLDARLWKPTTLDDIDTDSDEDTQETVTKDPPHDSLLSSCARSMQEHVVSHDSSLETRNRPLVQVDHEIAMEISKTTPEISAQTRHAYLQVKAQIGHLPGVTDEMIKSEVTKQMVARAMQRAALKVGVKERGADASRHASKHTAPLFDDHRIQQLLEHQFLVLEDVMEPATMRELRSEVEGLHAHGALKVTVQKNTGTRDDLIAWMDESEAAHAGPRRALPYAIELLKGVADVLNRAIPGTCLRVPARAMCACYPGAHHLICRAHAALTPRNI
ncbi:hypothetical protein CYMTET_41047 [Cymbomonas tetramitiformis]|uniref:Uncharacterized protein n=1 Tax=Cymbomonas tetramitiformis TaxID=36881 RepID=A0AAE0C6X9_9CHLO|nr:hypothetical protein CYMTET_41047 [Cymbomonas tetramitiformis]